MDKIAKIKQENNNNSNTNPANNNNNNNTHTNSQNLAPLIAILKQSFLRPQQPQAERLAARIGHRNKEPFLCEFFDLYTDEKFNSPNDRLEYLPLKVTYHPGLVAKKENKFVKDSADSVAIFEKSDVSFCYFVMLNVA